MKKSLLCIFMFVAFVVSVTAQTVLVTGFAPFGGEKINPAWQAVKQIPDCIDGSKIIKKQLLVSFKGSVNDLDK
ncbi:pyroglutamyl-peptidase I, partial [Francisella tularensis subsp. holarctica]|nr:pyroglutamyl-peptidase I [Francisella tularensis subsp. holarctica]